MNCSYLIIMSTNKQSPIRVAEGHMCCPKGSVFGPKMFCLLHKSFHFRDIVLYGCRKNHIVRVQTFQPFLVVSFSAHCDFHKLAEVHNPFTHPLW